MCVCARACVCMRDYPAVITQTNVMKYTLAVIVSYQLKYAWGTGLFYGVIFGCLQVSDTCMHPYVHMHMPTHGQNTWHIEGSVEGDYWGGNIKCLNLICAHVHACTHTHTHTHTDRERERIAHLFSFVSSKASVGCICWCCRTERACQMS